MSLSPSPILRTSHTSTIDGHQEYDKEKGHKLEQNELPFLAESGYKVRFEPEDDPQQLSLFRRWMAVATISSAALCVTCMASISDLITAHSISYSTHSLSLFSLAFTTYKHIRWITPIIAPVPFGTGTHFVYTSSFTYLIVAYRPIAASALASNSSMRSTFAAVFPLFAIQMYHSLGTVCATVLLACLAAVVAPLP